MTESNVKLIQYIDKHPMTSLCIIGILILLVCVGLGVGMTNIGNTNQQKVIDTFESLSCDELSKIPSSYGFWLTESIYSTNENEFYTAWYEGMRHCLGVR